MTGNDELYLIGLHLAQYRHATRSPTHYWREALRRDPGDTPLQQRDGPLAPSPRRIQQAEKHFRAAIGRLTIRNPNPYDGEPDYHLGLCLHYGQNGLLALSARCGAQKRALTAGKKGAVARGAIDLADLASSMSSSCTRMASMASKLGRLAYRDAYRAFAKAAWSRNIAPAALLALAEMDCREGEMGQGPGAARCGIAFRHRESDARDLKAIVLRKLNRPLEAETLLRETLARDPLDAWARYLLDRQAIADAQTRLDFAHDAARAGPFLEAIEVLQNGLPVEDLSDGQLPTQSTGAGPLIDYTLGWLYDCMGNFAAADEHYHQAAARAIDYCFPARLEEIAVLEAAIVANLQDAHAPYLLGNLLYDRRRYAEAIAAWEASAQD